MLNYENMRGFSLVSSQKGLWELIGVIPWRSKYWLINRSFHSRLWRLRIYQGSYLFIGNGSRFHQSWRSWVWFEYRIAILGFVTGWRGFLSFGIRADRIVRYYPVRIEIGICNFKSFISLRSRVLNVLLKEKKDWIFSWSCVDFGWLVVLLFDLEFLGFSFNLKKKKEEIHS